MQDLDVVKKSSDGFYEIAKRVIPSRKEKLLDPEEDPASSLLLERDGDGNPFDDFNLLYVVSPTLCEIVEF